MKYVLQITGLGLLVFFTLNMFFFWIMNDKIWLSFLFIGIIVYLLGAWIEHYNARPFSAEGRRRRRVVMRSCLYAIILACIPLILILLSYI